MALINGDDFVWGNFGTYQEWNRIKNNWRGSTPPSNIQPGMLFSDADDDKLYHAISGSGNPLEEVLQETLSADKTPQFDNLILDIDSSDISDPPTAAELNAIFPVAVAGFMGFVKDTSSGGSMWLVTYDGATWWVVEMAAAV
jgi:hypothetical protein